MIYRIVISHHQAPYLERFSKSFQFVAVFDNMDSSDKDAVENLGIQDIVAVPQKGNRSLNRNLGYTLLSSVSPLGMDDIVEFYDGDRVPQTYDPEYVERTIRENNLGVLLYTCEKDTRKSRYLQGESFRIVDTGSIVNPFYSCGFAIKVSALERIREFNGGDFFRTEFTGWGCEDQYTGLVCHHLNIPVGLTDRICLLGDVGGDSDWHLSYRESLQEYINMALANNLDIQP